MDWQRYMQEASLAVASAERRRHTGQILLSVDYRNGVPRRGHVRKIDCRVLNREPVPHSIDRPELEFERKKSEIRIEGANTDAQISILYTFFSGTVVDIRREVLNIMC